MLCFIPSNNGISFLKSLHLSMDLYSALERETEPPLDPSCGSFSGVWTTENYILEKVVRVIGGIDES